MADQNIIREFLVSLGFKVDEKGLKDFAKGVNDATLAVETLVGAISGAAMAIAADVTAFALRVENFYFTAQRSGAAVSTIKALGNAVKNFGIDSNEASSNVESLASAMRNNPGTEGLLNFLGVKTRDANNELRDTAKILVDLGNALQKYSPAVRNQYAKQFGLSERMLLAITNPAFEAAYKKQIKLQADVDFDEAAQKAHEFDVSIRQINTSLENFGAIFRSEVLDLLEPKMEKTARWLEENQEKISQIAHILGQALKDFDKEILTPILEKLSTIAEFLRRFAIWAGGKIFDEPPKPIDQNQDFSPKPSHGVDSSIGGLMPSHQARGKQVENNGSTEEAPKDRLNYLDYLDKKHRLPPGLMRYVVDAESGGDQYAVSPKGAMGAGQLMPGTAKQYGVKDPFDYYENTDAAARYYRDLFTKYSGNLEKAIAAYNWGPGNVDTKGLGAMPLETRRYIDKVSSGVNMNQTTHITVNGSTDPQRTADEIETRQRSVVADMTRNVENRLR